MTGMMTINANQQQMLNEKLLILSHNATRKFLSASVLSSYKFSDIWIWVRITPKAIANQENGVFVKRLEYRFNMD